MVARKAKTIFCPPQALHRGNHTTSHGYLPPGYTLSEIPNLGYNQVLSILSFKYLKNKSYFNSTVANLNHFLFKLLYLQVLGLESSILDVRDSNTELHQKTITAIFKAIPNMFFELPIQLLHKLLKTLTAIWHTKTSILLCCWNKTKNKRIKHKCLPYLVTHTASDKLSQVLSTQHCFISLTT